MRDATDAFRQIYDAYAGFVQYVAVRTGARGAEVDDVVQETFLRLHQHGAPADPAKVRAWLATTARNCAVDARRKRRREVGGDGIEEAAAPDGSGDQDREADLLLVRDLIDEVAAQPDGETFKLFYVDGLTAREIAARRGEAVSTVTTRLSRLRDKFKDRFRRRLEELRARRI